MIEFLLCDPVGPLPATLAKPLRRSFFFTAFVAQRCGNKTGPQGKRHAGRSGRYTQPAMRVNHDRRFWTLSAETSARAYITGTLFALHAALFRTLRAFLIGQ